MDFSFHVDGFTRNLHATGTGRPIHNEPKRCRIYGMAALGRQPRKALPINNKTRKELNK